MKKPVTKDILDLLKNTATIRQDMTGKVIIVLHLTQGGLNDSSLSVIQKLK